jgi:MoaA/NifB/PqqE/SkfB family radical SAM enzyme
MCGRMRPLKAAPKVWNYLKYRAYPRRERTAVQRYTPQICSLALTKRCNLNCGYCNVAAQLRDGRGGNWREHEVNLPLVRRIFENPLFGNCILVDLLGGEPLLVNDLDSIVAFLSGRGHLINTSTNGLLLRARIASLKRAGISRINVSFYDENRAVLERDLPGINAVFPVHASIVLLNSQIEAGGEKVLDLARFVRETGCLSLRFWMYRPMGVDPRAEEVIRDDSAAYLDFKRRMERALPHFCLWPAVVRPAPPPPAIVKKLCVQPWQRVGCDARGTVGICCGTEATLEGEEGNLFASPPDIVFNHPTLVSLRRRLLDPASDPPEMCRTCNLLQEPGW